MPLGAPRKSTTVVVGTVGDAAGLRLRELACANLTCTNALDTCFADDRCDTVELRFVSQKRQAGKCSAILRSSYVRWGTNDPSLEPEVALCKSLAEYARSGAVKPGEYAHFRRRQLWREHFCDEYAAARGHPLPPLGFAYDSPPPGKAHCPQAGTKFMVFTYQNGPSPWLCTFLRTLAYRGVPVTVLGWEPAAFSRMNNVYYFTDRVYTYLRYLETCDTWSPNASLIFCDADEMLQIGLDALERRTNELYHSTGARIIISAEARCMPQKLGKLSWAHSIVAAGGEMPKKWPRCLNTGNWVGRVKPIRDMLRQICRPCQEGLDIYTIFRKYARAYSARVKEWIYSEQAELMRLYLARPTNETGWILDFTQRLFHPNFWFNPNSDNRVLRDGRITNVHSGSLPAFVHYNGNSKTMWVGRFSATSLSAALRQAYEERSGDVTLELLGIFFEKNMYFLGPSFERDTSVTFGDVCHKGAI